MISRQDSPDFGVFEIIRSKRRRVRERARVTTCSITLSPTPSAVRPRPLSTVTAREISVTRSAGAMKASASQTHLDKNRGAGVGSLSAPRLKISGVTPDLRRRLGEKKGGTAALSPARAASFSSAYLSATVAKEECFCGGRAGGGGG